jgi:hypothetical protein
MHPVEPTAAIGLRWLAAGLVVSGLSALLRGPIADHVTSAFLIHLGALTAMSVVMAAHLGPHADRTWFSRITSPSISSFSSAAAVTIAVTGVTGLVTLASSAALAYAPSGQFLQLLSALDIAWVVAAFSIGMRWLFGPRLGIGAGLMMGVVCVWSIWRYIDRVGLGDDGGWIVSGDALLRYVIPFDVMAAVLAVGAVALGSRRRQPTAHPSDQSYP